MKPVIKFSFILLILLSYFVFAEIKVTYVGGEGYVKRGNENRRITQNMLIKPGDVITTGPRSFVALLLKDGSVHKISANTVYEVQKLEENDSSRFQIFNLIKGKIFSFVSKTFKTSDIKFLTPTAVVGVRGTAFVIEVNSEDTLVYLLEGKVDLTRSLNDTNPPTPLSSGKKAILPAGQAPVVETMDENDFKDAAKDIPLSLGEVIINSEEDTVAKENTEKSKERELNEVRSYVDESIARVEIQRNEINENKVWDYQTRKSIGDYRVRQVVTTPADNEVNIVTYTFDTKSKRETSLALNMIFDQAIPSYQDVVNGVKRNIDKIDWRITVSKGDLQDNLFYTKDFTVNSEEVYFNSEKGSFLDSKQLTIQDTNVKIPTVIKFQINGGEYTFNLDYSYINSDGTKYSDITIDKETNPEVYNKVLNGDVDTKILVTATLPSNSIANLITNGESFNIILLNGFIFPLFNHASGI